MPVLVSDVSLPPVIRTCLDDSYRDLIVNTNRAATITRAMLSMHTVFNKCHSKHTQFFTRHQINRVVQHYFKQDMPHAQQLLEQYTRMIWSVKQKVVKIPDILLIIS